MAFFALFELSTGTPARSELCGCSTPGLSPVVRALQRACAAAFRRGGVARAGRLAVARDPSARPFRRSASSAVHSDDLRRGSGGLDLQLPRDRRAQRTRRQAGAPGGAAQSRRPQAVAVAAGCDGDAELVHVCADTRRPSRHAHLASDADALQPSVRGALGPWQPSALRLSSPRGSAGMDLSAERGAACASRCSFVVGSAALVPLVAALVTVRCLSLCSTSTLGFYSLL